MENSKEIIGLVSEHAVDSIRDSEQEVQCDHEWQGAFYNGPDPFPGLEGWEVYCEKCNQWAFQEAVEVDDCDWQPFGEPIIFNEDTFCLHEIDD